MPEQTWAPPELVLGIGEMAFATKPCLIRTVLGSCVGVAIHDPRLRIGGMCHYLIAEAPRGCASSRYGDTAMDFLLRRFLRAGSEPRRLLAWVAGGGLLLDQDQVFFVGDRNVEMADRFLERWGLQVMRREVGGGRARRMSLRSDTGEVVIQAISRLGYGQALVV